MRRQGDIITCGTDAMPVCRLSGFFSAQERGTRATASTGPISHASQRNLLLPIRLWLLGFMLAATLIGFACGDVHIASAQYSRHRTNRSGAYGGYGYRGPGTAQSAAQFGMARMIAASGNANLMNSAAARNLTAAKSADIANRVQWTNAYHQMRQSHKAYVASNITRLSTDELNKIAQDQAPKRLDVTQIDSATGVIHWPVILRDNRYIVARDDLDRLFKIRAMSTGPIDPESYQDIYRTCEKLREQLKANIDDYRESDFEHARHFIESLSFEGTFPTG
ncbi:MAG TPA: hypothetical protein VGJ26_14195 [Pirellulales bacterium]|jgi:hypothetical protein